MLPNKFEGNIFVMRGLNIDLVKSELQKGFVSAVGHQGTADALSKLLGINILVNRVQIKINPGDSLIVFQLSVRLAEGQILTKEEIENLYKEGKASFDFVKMI
jgi:hypothetical protein